MTMHPPHLKALEAESIHILREVAAQAARPVLLYSIGKDSSVLLHLARKAFFPAKPPFPLLHIDTTWKFRDMIRFRDATAKRFGLDLRVHTNPEGLRQNINPFDHGSNIYTQVMKTDALKQALTEGRYDAAIGGARRDEERSRAKERVFSVRGPGHSWDPKRQRPELWHLYNGNLAPGETLRVFPLSNWTELDVWTYILAEGIDVVPLYFAAPRPTVERDGLIIVVDDERMRFQPGERPVDRLVRFRSLGCYPLSAAVDSSAARPGGDRRRNAHHARVGTRGTADRPGPGRLDGEEEARGIFLMPDSLLRVLACGSVDDGKSTLIGRLLFECGTIPDDVMAALERDSIRFGTVPGGTDYALLVDGLAAERDQGITIDVAYRFFETPRRRFILADAPGHEQYTRNMVTGASASDLAMLLVDARKGLLVQTRRHAAIASLLGIRQVVLAVNKMDLVGFDQAVFDTIVTDFYALLGQAGTARGDRDPGLRARRRQRDGAEHADAVVFGHDAADRAGGRRTHLACRRTRIPHAGAVCCAARPYVPRLCRHGGDRDRVRPGATVVNAVSGTEAKVSRIVTMDGDLAEAVPGEAVTLVLDREIDVSRGDVLAVAPPPALADQVTAWVVWMDETPLFRGRAYLFMLGSRSRRRRPSPRSPTGWMSIRWPRCRCASWG